MGAYTGGYSGLQGMTGGDSGTHGMCTKADRGLQGVHGLTLGAQEMTGKTHGVTGEDIFIRTGFFRASSRLYINLFKQVTVY